MKIYILFLSFYFWTATGFPEIPARHFAKDSPKSGVQVEFIGNGSTYRFTNMHEKSVITVLSNGDVIADVWRNDPTQKWTVVEHPRNPLFVEFKQKVVPYNMLSGFEPIPDEPDIYPRPLGLTKHRIMPSLKDKVIEPLPIPWQILIRVRWCLQTNGIGRPLTYDDCEYQPAPWQFWKLEVVDP